MPVNADVPDMTCSSSANPTGSTPSAPRLGEVGLVGVSAAIANAVYHATGRRIRSLPVTLDKLL